MCWRKKTRLPSAQRLGPVPFDTQALHWCQRGHRRPLPRLRLGVETREGRFPEFGTADNGAPDGHELCFRSMSQYVHCPLLRPV